MKGADNSMKIPVVAQQSADTRRGRTVENGERQPHQYSEAEIQRRQKIMNKNNPMKNPETAKKSASTRKGRTIANGGRKPHVRKK